MKSSPLFLLIVLAWAAAAAGQSAPASAPASSPAAAPSPAPAPAPPKKPCVVIFDFAAAAGSQDGEQLADSVRLRLARNKDYQVIDRLSTAEVAGAVKLEATSAEMLELMKKLGANIAIWGGVERTGALQVTANIRCLDLRMPKEPVEWARKFVEETERARGLLAKDVVEALTGQLEWKPPEYGDEPEPAKWGPSLNVNGDFEQKSKGWQRPDNVSSFIVAQDGRGGVLKIDTALARDPWLEYQRQLMFGKADPDKPPKIARDTSYGSVAGLEGVHFASEWIKAAGGQRYWLTADAKGGGGSKIFVKGFRSFAEQEDTISESALEDLKLTPRDFAGLPQEQRKKLIEQDAAKNPMRYLRETYRWYLNCGDSGGKWKHFAAPFPPRGGLGANVEWLQIQVYAYWPPGEYLYDNVHLYADPRQSAPLKEEPRRTPSMATQRAAATQPAP